MGDIQELNNNQDSETNPLNVNIPILFEEYFQNTDLTLRHERHENIRIKCRNKYKKYGMEDVFDHYDATIKSLMFPDSFNEKRLIYLCCMFTFLLVFEDFLDCSLNYKYVTTDETSDTANTANTKPQKYRKINRLSVYKFVVIYATKLIQFKFSIYQWYKFFWGFFSYVLLQLYKPKSKIYKTYEEYTAKRTIDIGGDAPIICLHKVFGYDFKPTAFNHALIKKFNKQFSILLWQINDLYSFKKELVRNEHQMNSITVLKYEHSISWQSSVDKLADKIRNGMIEFNKIIDEIRESKLDVSFECLKLMANSLYIFSFAYRVCKQYHVYSDINITQTS